MVRIFVGVTHRPWFAFLSARAPDEVNFWQPSGSSEFKALRPGDLFLFKLKGRDGMIAGGGVFNRASLAPLSLAWEAFGEKNGNASLAEMRATIGMLRHQSTVESLRGDPVIGCRILTEPFFWPEDLWIPTPASFQLQTVVGIGLRRAEYGTHSMRRTKAAMIYRATGNIRAIQILLGHTKIENTVRYLGVDIEDALLLAERTEI